MFDLYCLLVGLLGCFWFDACVFFAFCFKQSIGCMLIHRFKWEGVQF